MCQLVCGQNSVVSGLTCVCSPGFYNISGSCQTCPAGSTYNTASQTCIQNCGSNQVSNNGQCVCITGYSMVNNQCYQTTASCGTNKYLLNGVCKCLPHLLDYQGGCYTCPTNSQVTADQTGCACLPGHSVTSQFTCQPINAQGSSQTTVQGASNTQSSSSQPSQSSQFSSFTSGGTNTNTNTNTNSGFFSGTSSGSGTTSGTSSGTINLYGGSTTTNSGSSSTSTTTSTSNCPTGDFYQNGVCRPAATITASQTALFNNAVYVNILAKDLPNALINNGVCNRCPDLIVVSLLNSVSGAQAAINYIPSTSFQWVASIAFQQQPPLPQVTLQLKFNPLYSTLFSIFEMNQAFSVFLDPNTMTALNLPVQTTGIKSLSTDGDVLDELVPPQVLSFFSKEPQSP